MLTNPGAMDSALKGPDPVALLGSGPRLCAVARDDKSSNRLGEAGKAVIPTGPKVHVCKPQAS